MKKLIYILTILLLGAATQTLSAQTPADLIEKYKEINGVESKSVGKEELIENGIFDRMQEIAVNGRVDSMTAIGLVQCDEAVINEFREEIKVLKNIGEYEELNVDDVGMEGAEHRVMIKKESGLIREIYIFLHLSLPDPENPEQMKNVAIITVLYGEMEDVDLTKMG